jgi:hypothetical protein
MAAASLYHCVPPTRVDMPIIAEGLARVGLRPLFHDAQQAIAEKLRPWALESLTLPSSDIEVFLSADLARAVCMRLRQTPRTTSHVVVDILSLGEGESSLPQSVMDQFPAPLRPHSWTAQLGIDRLAAMAGSLGQNGRILGNTAQRAKSASSTRMMRGSCSAESSPPLAIIPHRAMPYSSSRHRSMMTTSTRCSVTPSS